VVETGDHQPLSDAIARLLDDPALAARLAAAGQDHVRAHFTWENTIRGFESVWDELLAARQAQLSQQG
ncbi:MAG: glycosyltransferase, partial [Planctomycetaceae bacterium]